MLLAGEEKLPQPPTQRGLYLCTTRKYGRRLSAFFRPLIASHSILPNLVSSASSTQSPRLLLFSTVIPNRRSTPAYTTHLASSIPTEERNTLQRFLYSPQHRAGKPISSNRNTLTRISSWEALLVRPSTLTTLAVEGPLSRSAYEDQALVPFKTETDIATKLTRFPAVQTPEVLEKRLADFVYKLHSYQQSWEGSGKRQCPGPRDHPGLGDQDSMSQRLPASRPASRSPPDGQRITLPPVQLRDDPQHAGRHLERQHPEPEERALAPPLQPSPQHGQTNQPSQSGEDWRPSGPLRDLGVHSMLNPTESISGGSTTRQLSGATAVSPMSTSGPVPPFGTSSSPAPQHTFPGQYSPSSGPPNTDSYGGTFPRIPRRILTPRSPSRGVSSGRPRVQGTIDAQQSPFLPSRRSYTAIPGESALSDIPPMPTSPAPGLGGQQSHYGFPPPASAPSIAPRRSSMQAPGRTPLSQSASPSISASSYNPSSSQTSPASFLKGGPPPSSGPYYPGSSFSSTLQQGGGMQFQGPSGIPEGPYNAPATQSEGSSFHSSSAGSSRQTSATDPIQVLTITTSQGSYSVPVDVHQASRLADEKRARNAGASARFRQRRKEKEKEANSAIEKLQSQTRDLERKLREVQSERDFYRAERDRFRDVVFRTPDVRHLAMQGPPSPQSGRSASFQGPISQMGGPHPPVPHQLGYQAPESPERAPRRRRSDIGGNYTSLPYTLPPASTLPPVPTGYQAAHGQPPNLPLPPLRTEPNVTSTGAPAGAPVATSAGPPGPFDPYARGAYERGWPGDGGRR